AWSGDADDLHLVAVELVAPLRATRPPAVVQPSADPAEAALADRLTSTVPGLPDDAYVGDGQLTRAEVRAVVLAALAPRPGELLWDLGAGSGTVSIEWVRAAPGARAVGIERRDDRSATITENAARLGAAEAAELGAPGLSLLTADIEDRLDALPEPDAIFVGGGGTSAVIERCWAALRPGGRIVANAVTLEGEQALVAAASAHGGTLIRLEFSRAEPLGGFTGWKPHRPIVQWAATKDPA
ncbi:MAG: precorrin-6Y C5,15-methyltransferase (decarboxylating) subunit CbiT, partial [Patulibacter sp.]|nr:precorrin-6Y C5,15-methyltransferase (decarboxylating) subunit CbiT [Patulibacter sp.]